MHFPFHTHNAINGLRIIRGLTIFLFSGGQRSISLFQIYVEWSMMAFQSVEKGCLYIRALCMIILYCNGLKWNGLQVNNTYDPNVNSKVAFSSGLILIVHEHIFVACK